MEAGCRGQGQINRRNKRSSRCTQRCVGSVCTNPRALEFPFRALVCQLVPQVNLLPPLYLLHTIWLIKKKRFLVKSLFRMVSLLLLKSWNYIKWSRDYVSNLLCNNVVYEYTSKNNEYTHKYKVAPNFPGALQHSSDYWVLSDLFKLLKEGSTQSSALPCSLSFAFPSSK